MGFKKSSIWISGPKIGFYQIRQNVIQSLLYVFTYFSIHYRNWQQTATIICFENQNTILKKPLTTYKDRSNQPNHRFSIIPLKFLCLSHHWIPRIFCRFDFE